MKEKKKKKKRGGTIETVANKFKEFSLHAWAALMRKLCADAAIIPRVEFPAPRYFKERI